jgi:hypothetical protein
MPCVTTGRFLKKPGVRVQPPGTVVLLLLVVLTEVLDTEVLDAEVLLTEVLGVVEEVDDVGSPPNAAEPSETMPTTITNALDLISPFLSKSGRGGPGIPSNSASRQGK